MLNKHKGSDYYGNREEIEDMAEQLDAEDDFLGVIEAAKEAVNGL